VDVRVHWGIQAGINWGSDGVRWAKLGNVSSLHGQSWDPNKPSQCFGGPCQGLNGLIRAEIGQIWARTEEVGAQMVQNRALMEPEGLRWPKLELRWAKDKLRKAMFGVNMSYI